MTRFHHMPVKCMTGFTLMEIMVALAILSIALVGVMHVFTSSLTGIGKSELYTEAALVARQVMEAKLIDPNLAEGTEVGTYLDIFDWELDVVRQPVVTGDDMDSLPSDQPMPVIDWLEEESPVVLYELTVTVSWPNAGYPGQFTLKTLSTRVEPEEEAEGEPSE